MPFVMHIQTSMIQINLIYIALHAAPVQYLLNLKGYFANPMIVKHTTYSIHHLFKQKNASF